MNDDDFQIVEKHVCQQCKHYNWIDRFLAVCENGRPRKDFNENGGLTECKYWESKT